jgi:hypothetical protein
MIGVLLTSTCFFPGIDKQTFSDRVEELAHSISTLEKYVHQPFELIVADNSIFESTEDYNEIPRVGIERLLTED